MRAYLCVVYVSEGLRSAVISNLQHVAATSSPSCLFAHSFVDEAYNRTGVYLLSRSRQALISAALAVSRSAFASIDFGQHQGTHPALGSVDHVCFSQLGADGSGSPTASKLGRDFGRALNEQEGVDVYFYGGASPGADTGSPRSLRDIRSDLGYFSAEPHVGAERAHALRALVRLGAQSGTGGPALCAPESGGEAEATSRFASKGVTCVGVVPLVRNLNMRFARTDSKALVARVTAGVRVPGAVEALTLPWQDCFEVACNLRSSAPEHSPEAVLARALALAAPLGLTLETHYCTGPGEAELLQLLQDREDSGALPKTDDGDNE